MEEVLSLHYNKGLWDCFRCSGASFLDADTLCIFRVNSIRVESGAWICYDHPDFKGQQYILEHGEYPEFQRWNSHNDHMGSCKPIRMVNTSEGLSFFHTEPAGHTFHCERHFGSWRVCFSFARNSQQILWHLPCPLAPPPYTTRFLQSYSSSRLFTTRIQFNTCFMNKG